MNIEETKEAIRVMQAYVDGKEVESLYGGKWALACIPRWDWDDTDYRIKSTPVLRPWTADEVPLGAWMRVKDSPKVGQRIMICGTCEEHTRSTWLSKNEHSTDGGKTWSACGVVEEAK